MMFWPSHQAAVQSTPEIVTMLGIDIRPYNLGQSVTGYAAGMIQVKPVRVRVRLGQREYTYECDHVVQVGDTAVVANPRHPDLELSGEVVGIGSDYTGDCKKVIRVTKWNWVLRRVHNETYRTIENVIEGRMTTAQAVRDFAERLHGWVTTTWQTRLALQKLADKMAYLKQKAQPEPMEDEFILELEATKPK